MRQACNCAAPIDRLRVILATAFTTTRSLVYRLSTFSNVFGMTKGLGPVNRNKHVVSKGPFVFSSRESFNLRMTRLAYHLGFTLFTLLVTASVQSHAQGLPGSTARSAQPAASPTSSSAGGTTSSDNEVEALYDKEDSKPKASPAKKVEDRAPAPKIPEAQNLSDLAKLAPFSDVAVIQRRFLPKSQRFEATVGAFTNLNNPFFSSYGVELKGAYYLTEKWAAEAIGSFATTASRQVTDDLAKNRGITTSNLVTSRSFFGGAIKWNPIYGKITLLNKSIVPFDLNLDVGGGLTQTTDGQSVPTLHAGTSQVFAYSKSTAFRWDFSLNAFQADATDDNNFKSKITQFDIYLGVGVSFYFPEASYR